MIRILLSSDQDHVKENAKTMRAYPVVMNDMRKYLQGPDVIDRKCTHRMRGITCSQKQNRLTIGHVKEWVDY